MFAENALSSKAKAMYGKRLKEIDYENLLNMHSVSEVAEYLKQKSDYQQLLKDVRENTIHRGQLEALLKQNHFLKLQKLLRYVDLMKHPFYQMILIQEEVEQILSCIRSIMAKQYQQFITHLPLFMNPYLHFDLYQLMEAKKVEDLIKVLSHSEYGNILAPYLSEKLDYSACEVALYRYLYEKRRAQIAKEFHGNTRKDLLNMLDTQMELKNVCIIYRMKEYFHMDKEQIRAKLILPHARLSSRMYETLLNAKDGKAVLSLLEASHYHLYTDEKEFVYIEYFCRKICYHLGKRFMYYANNAAVIYLAYNIQSDIEIENIINIIEGIRYQIPAERIAGLLIY